MQSVSIFVLAYSEFETYSLKNRLTCLTEALGGFFDSRTRFSTTCLMDVATVFIAPLHRIITVAMILLLVN